MKDMWETDELYNWISSDEYLYHAVLGMTAEQLRLDWDVLSVCRSKDIDPDLVDWDELAACINDE